MMHVSSCCCYCRFLATLIFIFSHWKRKHFRKSARMYFFTKRRLLQISGRIWSWRWTQSAKSTRTSPSTSIGLVMTCRKCQVFSFVDPSFTKLTNHLSHLTNLLVNCNTALLPRDSKYSDVLTSVADNLTRSVISELFPGYEPKGELYDSWLIEVLFSIVIPLLLASFRKLGWFEAILRLPQERLPRLTTAVEIVSCLNMFCFPNPWYRPVVRNHGPWSRKATHNLFSFTLTCILN